MKDRFKLTTEARRTWSFFSVSSVSPWLIIYLLFFPLSVSAREDSVRSFRYSGQVSAWGQFAPDNALEGWFGGRYIPQLDYKLPLKKKRLIDFEASANIFGDVGFSPFDSVTTDGKIKPYRAWARYSTDRMELRLGLQKINFGSAQMFRPLMWFDRVDPRDPLQLTDGVWGLLFRRYFQNNANIWIWGLYGNDDPKGWEVIPTSSRYPEAGGRAQLPVPRGEAALSYHFRVADASDLGAYLPETYGDVGENRIGFDMRLDVTVGLWLETSWTRLNKDFGILTNQEMITLGTDYTFGIGNGLAATFEQLVYSNDRYAFGFANTTTFSGLSLSYPVGMFDNISAMIYYDWTNNGSYNFINWQRQLNHITLYVMAYWNPATYQIPAQAESNRFAGKGLQVMLVWNH